MLTEAEKYNRLKDFKNKGRDVEDLRRRRTDVSVEIRKTKRDDHLLKRRNIIDIEEQEENLSMSIEDIISAINSGNKDKELKATRAARTILSRETNPPIHIFIDANVIPKLIEFLSRTTDPDLQFESAWVLTNIASGTSAQTLAVANANAVEELILLLGSQHPMVAEQAVWALGNIAGDGPQLRDQVASAGIIKPMLNLLKPTISATCLENVTWTLSNLCRNGNSPLCVDSVRELLPALKYLIHSDDKHILTDACWALYFLSVGPSERIQEVVDAGVVPRLVALLDSAEVSVIAPALRTIGNIVTGNDVQTDSVLAVGCCPLLAKLLRHSNAKIVKEAAWTLSSIATGNVIQIEALITNNVVRPLIEVLAKGDFKCQSAAAWVIYNISVGGTVEQTALLYQCGVLQPLCALLEAEDTSTISIILDSLANLLAAAETMNELEKVSLHVEECGGLERIEQLQNHENVDVYRKSLTVIEQYFDEESQLAPSTCLAGFCQFNRPSQGYSF